VAAHSAAPERGIVLEKTTREAQGDYDLITLDVRPERHDRLVAGTVYADGRPASSTSTASAWTPASRPRWSLKPGFIGEFGTTLCAADINIATFHVGRTEPGGNAITLVEIDSELPPDVLARVESMARVQQVKPLRF
jgi:D-3-phosphoglycerate dehydrogenase / 2-oxoglutarate reductase